MCVLFTIDLSIEIVEAIFHNFRKGGGAVMFDAFVVNMLSLNNEQKRADVYALNKAWFKLPKTKRI